MVLSASSKRRRDLCIRRRGLSSAGDGAHGGRQAAFLRKARAYGGSCPWRESETRRQKGHRHRESERRGGDFLRETKRRAACPERKLAFNSGEGGSGKKGARRFCRKRAARRKRMSACGRGISAGKREGLYRTERARAKRKALYAAAATAGEERASPYGKNKAAFRAAFLRKTKPRQIGVSDRHRVARIPTILKGSEAVSFCFRRR